MGKVGHASRGEVRLGDGEVLGRSVELSGAGRSLEVNEEAGEHSPCPVVGGARENVFHKLGMTGHKDFFESEVKTEEDTLSKGVTKKDTQTRFGVEFVGRVGKT